MEAISAEEFLERVPEDERRTAVSLRVGILSLPGMEERCLLDPATNIPRVDFTVNNRVAISVFAVTPLRAELQLSPEELASLVEAGDVSHLEFEPWGAEGARHSLAEIGRVGEEAGPVSLAIRSQEDLRSVTRLTHARYDAMITG